MKTTKILLILSLFAATSLSAAEDQFKLVTRVVVLPQKEFATKQKFKALIPDDELQLFMREISKVAHANLLTTPSIVVPLKKKAMIEIVRDTKFKRIDSDDVERIGHIITYRLESIDGVLKLDGIFKHSEMNDDGKAGDVSIDTEEIIFKRICELDKSILVSRGDTHIFITLTKWKEEPE